MTRHLSAAHLSLRQLRAFVAVAHAQSMTRAAAQLHLTPSALSMLVRGLEEELGLRLFERTTRKLILTAAGRDFLPSAEQVFGVLESGLQALAVHHPNETPPLRVASSPLLASGLLPRVIASLRAESPSMRIQLHDVPVPDLPMRVREGHVDLAIGTATRDAADLKAIPLYADPLMLVCAPDHPLARRAQVSWQELLDEPLVLLQRDSGLRTLVDDTLAKWSRRAHIAQEVTHVATALALVAEGEGIAPLPSYAISRAQAHLGISAGVAAIALVEPVVTRQIVAWIAPGAQPHPAQEAFLAQFRKMAGKP